jgi:hypothetical protein
LTGIGQNVPGTGSYNTATGGGALADNTTGSYNTADGNQALSSNTTGQNNSAFGAFALGSNSGGSYNLAVGLYAMAYNSSGSENTASGEGALQYNSTASNNTATGYDSMGGAGSKTGGGNTGDGSNSLFFLTTGYNNEAIGLNALYSNTTGVDNVAIGVSDFYNNPTGSTNTACGTYAFQNMTSGNGNVGLGYYAGNSLTSGDNNIYIGNSGASSESNIIRIGSTQTATYFSGEFISVEGLTPVEPYIGDDGSGDDVQIGSLLSGVTNVSCYNEADQAYMHLYVSSITITGGSDLAEPFRISKAKQPVVEGDVVVIDDAHPGQLKLTDQPYDTRVAGVVSGANGIHPGIQMQQQGLLDGGKNVALTGRVYVQADTSNGPIKPGDMLTTSGTPGRAMKVTDHGRAQGAILGKAMSSLNDGQGMVLVLVTLQ